MTPVKVLFVGEGPDDVGRGDGTESTFPASGTIPTLARKVTNRIAVDSRGALWRSIKVLQKQHGAGRSGEYERSRLAVAMACGAKCSGVVVVLDQDRIQNRLQEIENGLAQGVSNIRDGVKFKSVAGVAVESIEAWTLGAHSAIQHLCNKEILKDQALPTKPEALWNRSQKPAKQGKAIIANLARQLHMNAGQFRSFVAEDTDIAELERNCPAGFKPFADRLRKSFPNAP